jgi:hypothetical protein
MLPSSRLSNTEIDQLFDKLHEFVRGAANTSYANYETGVTGRQIGIMRSEGSPRANLTTWCSFGLAHSDWSAFNFPHRLEIVQAWADPGPAYERLIATVAGTMISVNKWVKPGSIFLNSAAQAGLDELARRMPHSLVLNPYLWDSDTFGGEVQLATHRVWFLQIVSIFEDERLFIEAEGLETFEEFLSAEGARFPNPDRWSYVNPQKSVISAPPTSQ